MTVLVIIGVLNVIYFYLIKGRIGYTNFSEFKNHRFAHRGLYNAEISENSISAFKRAVNDGYGAELDVRITLDKKIVVFHDESLKRMTGVEGSVEKLTLKQLKALNLQNTNEKIPTLREVFTIFEGKTPIIIELKSTFSNYEELCFYCFTELLSYKGDFCIESFDPRCVRWFKNHAPQIIRGQLAQNFFKVKKVGMPLIYKFAATFLLSAFWSKPDFIAYKYKDRNNLSFKICTRFYKMYGVAWTLKTESDMQLCENEGLIPIFEEKKTG